VTGLIEGDVQVSKTSRTKQTAREKIARMQALEAQRRRRRYWIAGISAAVLVIIAAIGITLTVASGGANPAGAGKTPGLRLAPLSTLGALQPAPVPGPPGPEGVPVPAAAPLASIASGATGRPVDGISCQTTEQTLFHIHAHLTIFVNGAPTQLPAGIGIPGAQSQTTSSGTFITGGTCLYWLHTHAADGIIHIESPIQRVYTLGQVFDEWGQPLGPGRLGPVSGHVTALYNGQVYQGSPRSIPLNAHAQIQLEVGSPLIAPQAITFPGGL
jgi:hypothetical protein